MTQDVSRNYDDGKLRYDLLPARALAQIVNVFTYGAKKYTTEEFDGARNWELGMPFHHHLGSMMRHIEAYRGGEDIDPESGCSHLAMAATRCMMLLELHDTHPALDDRPGKNPVSDYSVEALKRDIEAYKKIKSKVKPLADNDVHAFFHPPVHKKRKGKK